MSWATSAIESCLLALGGTQRFPSQRGLRESAPWLSSSRCLVGRSRGRRAFSGEPRCVSSNAVEKRMPTGCNRWRETGLTDMAPVTRLGGRQK